MQVLKRVHCYTVQIVSNFSFLKCSIKFNQLLQKTYEYTINKMNFISRRNRKVSICSTCLSSERKVYCLKEDQYAAIVCKELKLGLNKKSTNICWECRAMLHKVVKFKEIALKAQCTLKLYKSYRKNSEKIVPLSNLKIKNLEHVNCVHDIKEEEEKKVTEEYTRIDIKDEFEVDYDLKPDVLSISNEQDETFVTNIKNEEVVAPVSDETSFDTFFSDDYDDDERSDDNRDDINNADDIRDEHMYKSVVLNEVELMEHRETCRKRLSVSYKLLKCDSCIVGFQSENALTAHKNKHHTLNKTPFKCSICDTYFKRSGKLNVHYENHYNLYQCTECGYKSDKRPSVVEHFRRSHNKSWFSCRICKQRFQKHCAMVYHRKTAHTEVECTVCGKILKEKYTLKMHMLLHTGMPTFNCDICKKSYRGKWGIRAHMKTVHGRGAPNIENAYCTECDAQFRSMYIYNQHLRTHSRHVLQRLFCDMCDKSFTTKAYLTNHIMLVHDKSAKHICTTCNRAFVKRSVLLSHVKYVHYKEEKPKRFECSVCHKKFAAKTVLNDHLNLHTGNRPYKCELCEAAFPNKGVLYRHKKFVHKMKKLSERGRENDA